MLVLIDGLPPTSPDRGGFGDGDQIANDAGFPSISTGAAPYRRIGAVRKVA
ncbi:hypothetical protein GFS60_06899 (plasmid) [Rhodococcus sp. WAY2]|nr:hypothetical protein GFS60_06899 [Rhodococcus sp. WAY2]